MCQTHWARGFAHQGPAGKWEIIQALTDLFLHCSQRKPICAGNLCVYTHVCTCTENAHTHAYTYMRVHTCAENAHTCMNTHAEDCTRMHALMCIYTHAQKCTHMHIHMLAHTMHYTHARVMDLQVECMQTHVHTMHTDIGTQLTSAYTCNAHRCIRACTLNSTPNIYTFSGPSGAFVTYLQMSPSFFPVWSPKEFSPIVSGSHHGCRDIEIYRPGIGDSRCCNSD